MSINPLAAPRIRVPVAVPVPVQEAERLTLKEKRPLFM
jgi:hypothetical protein